MPILGNFPGGGSTNEFFGLCDSTLDSEEKEVFIPGVKLNEGTRITVKFTYNHNYTGTHVIPKLNVNNTGPMKIEGAYSWESGDILEFMYVGNAWQVIGGGNATTENYGSVKLLSSDFDSMSCAEWYSVPTASKVKFALSDAKKKATTSSYGSVQLLPGSFPLSGSSYSDTVPTAGQVDAIYNMAKTAKEQAELKATDSSYGSVMLLPQGFPVSGCNATELLQTTVPTSEQVNAIYNMAKNAYDNITPHATTTQYGSVRLHPTNFSLGGSFTSGTVPTSEQVGIILNQLYASSLKFACSRYTGNGATSRTFTFDFKPYLFVSVAEAAFGYTIIAVRDMKIVGQVNAIPPDVTKASNISWGEKSITFSPYGASGTADSMNNYNQGSYAYFAIGI